MRPEKKAIVSEIKQQLEDAGFVVLVDCRGLSVEDMSELRDQLNGQDSRLTVVRNAFLGVAAKESDMPDLSGLLEGPTAIITGAGDVTQTAKILNGFMKENQLPVLKGGTLGTRVLTVADIKELAAIPPRPVLYGRLAGVLAAPMTQLCVVMNRKAASLVYVLKAVADKKAASN